jgi:hypothetical protein
MRSLYDYLTSHPKVAGLFFAFLLAGILVIGWEVRVILQKIDQIKQSAGPQGPTPSSLHPVNISAADPKLSAFMQQYRLGPKAAKYLSNGKVQILDQTDTSVHLSITFPDKFTIDETATVAADPSYTPTPADLERAAKQGSNVHGAKLTFQDKGPKMWMSTLQYHVPYSAVPRELLEKIQHASTKKASASHFFDLIPEALAQQGGGEAGGGGPGGGELTGEMAISVVANYLSEAYKGLDPNSIKSFKELEEGLENDNLKSLGADAPLAIVDAFEDYLKWNEWNEKIEKLVDCAKNPTNPLSQKASQDSHYQHDVMDQLEGADSDMFWSFAPQAASDVAGYISHFLPFFGGGVVVGVVFSTQDQAVEQWADGRIEEAGRYVVPCEDKRPGREGSLEYTYSRHVNMPGNQVDAKASAEGNFQLKQDPNGHTVFAGEGEGKYEWDEKSNGYATKQHIHLSGPFSVSVNARGSPRDATVQLTMHGEHLTWTYACSGYCNNLYHDQKEHGLYLGCTFNGVDLVRGGTYSGPADSDATGGQTTCTVTLPSQ